MTKRGFTIVELLVALSVIVVILSLSLASVNGARARSRDAKRIADLRTIQSALEQHSLGDSSHSYPPGTSGAGDPNYCLKYRASLPTATYKGLYNNPCFSDYLSVVPVGPQGEPYLYERPACFRANAGAKGGIDLVTVANEAACGGIAFSASYGLHAALETANLPEAKADASRDFPSSYDLIP